jgi:hypothetical protein
MEHSRCALEVCEPVKHGGCLEQEGQTSVFRTTQRYDAGAVHGRRDDHNSYLKWEYFMQEWHNSVGPILDSSNVGDKQLKQARIALKSFA